MPDDDGPLRPLRRALRARDPDGAAPRAGGGLRRPRGATRPSVESSRRCLRDYVGRPTPADLRRAALGAPRLPRLPEARGPVPHRRPQDQQRARPGPAREAHGQDARGGRDRRGPARRRHRHRLRAARPRVRRLHGRPRTWRARPRTCAACACSAPRCAASTRARARSRTRSTRRCATGSRTCAPPTTCWARCWAPIPYPMMVRDFQSVIGEEARGQILGPGGHAARRARGLRRRRLQRDRPLPRVPRRPGGDGRRRGGRPLGQARRSRRALPAASSGRRGRRRAPRHAHLPAAGRGRQRAADPLGLGGPRLSGGRARARAAARRRAASATTPSATTRRSPPSTCWPRRRASCPRSSRPTPSPGSCARRASPPRPARAREPERPRRQGPGDQSKPGDAHRRASFAGAASATGRKAFVGFVTAGDPSLERTVESRRSSSKPAGVRRPGAGRAVLRSAGRRARDPAGQRAGAAARARRLAGVLEAVRGSARAASCRSCSSAT